MKDELLTTDEICEWLKVTRRTIERWRKNGLPFFKIGSSVRFNKEEVLKWIEQNSKQQN
ncbi:transcriptional regulator, AlpA family [Desulforamulus putei DSM 12395]|uniref:Transcriptional regulator, AlpA family n=1 Tax=Desulforamulus putei DSM 12395 TaxID=1121429 RepID=A0A1M5D0S8_9FIRM|nr:helix-turn-helix domain-containing protein [Desulforamulus putei]SHF60633.1 transcriptional regulator, AlpA family [Desulforamulus putei DSM 12395]